jgi:transcriptional regulator with AAA-type ATPase domain
MRLGGLDTIKVDVRIIAATNADLKQMTDDWDSFWLNDRKGHLSRWRVE